MRRILQSPKWIPLFFALITIVAYGLLLPLTGFYWDDWPFAWVAKFLGPLQFIPSFSGFRPFLGPIFFITTSLIPSDPILWQVFALIIHLAAGLCAWYALDQIWPHHKLQTLIASLLFLVFPGYSQHWVAFTHINQEWIPLIFYLLSFGFTARALRNPQKKILNSIIALLMLAIGVFPTEYFIGLEPLRFFFIWVIIAEETNGIKSRFSKTLKQWWPYFLIWIADAVWLAYYYKSGAYVSYGVTVTRHAVSVMALLTTLADAFWKAGLYVWIQVLVLTAQSITAPTTIVTFILIVLSFISVAFYILHLEFFPSPPAPLPVGEGGRGEGKNFALPALLIGILGILLGRIPSFAAGLPLTLQSSNDRFMISMMLAASLFATGLIDLLVKNRLLKKVVFALLIALGIGQQFFNANIFRRDWTRQQELYWELAWRIPALKPNTALLTDFVPIDYETDLSFTAPLNWMYAPDFQGGNLPYALIYVNKRLGSTSLSDLKPNTPIRLSYRVVAFQGSTSQAVAIYAPQNGCLRVFDPVYANAKTYNRFPSLTPLIPLSDPSRIITNASPPELPNPPFPNEPSHTWCYYYEQAELARQTGDWNKVVELGKEAAQKRFGPQDDFEWLPFIEADARAGDLKSAELISHQVWKDDAKLRPGLCTLWGRVQAEGPKEAQSTASNLLLEFGCR
jgi:hypothetical protein